MRYVSGSPCYNEHIDDLLYLELIKKHDFHSSGNSGFGRLFLAGRHYGREATINRAVYCIVYSAHICRSKLSKFQCKINLTRISRSALWSRQRRVSYLSWKKNHKVKLSFPLVFLSLKALQVIQVQMQSYYFQVDPVRHRRGADVITINVCNLLFRNIHDFQIKNLESKCIRVSTLQRRRDE